MLPLQPAHSLLWFGSWIMQGMANYNKNLFVGIGGSEAINLSHFIGAVRTTQISLHIPTPPTRHPIPDFKPPLHTHRTHLPHPSVSDP